MKQVSKKRTGKKVKAEYILYDIISVKKFNGYYAVETNLPDSVKDIFVISLIIYQINSCFNIMKTSLDGRQVKFQIYGA
ncbi:hypothetical protein K070079E91_06700 [Eisenbergiella porci]